LPPAFACRGSHAPPRSGACRLTARHGGANSAQGTQGAPRKMQRQGAATPGSTHRVSVGCAPSLRLPRQPQTAPLRRLPPAPLPSALRLKNNNNNNVQRQNLCFTDASEKLRTRSVRSRGGNRAEFPRCFPENVDLNFLGFRNPVFSIDTIWNPILEAVFVSFVWVNSCRKD
jgi:hypothetical protein